MALYTADVSTAYHDRCAPDYIRSNHTAICYPYRDGKPYVRAIVECQMDGWKWAPWQAGCDCATCGNPC